MSQEREILNTGFNLYPDSDRSVDVWHFPRDKCFTDRNTETLYNTVTSTCYYPASHKKEKYFIEDIGLPSLTVKFFIPLKNYHDETTLLSATVPSLLVNKDASYIYSFVNNGRYKQLSGNVYIIVNEDFKTFGDFINHLIQLKNSARKRKTLLWVNSKEIEKVVLQ